MGKIGAIINGPYLLAPTTAGVTISWETNFPVDATVWYGTNGKFDNQLIVKCKRGTPWKDSPDGICMYQGVLQNLNSATVYQYRVELSSGDRGQGTFKTLSEKPEKIRLVTLSDSHLFKVNREFTDVVLENKPDFIIHSGDISLATGYQKDEYTTNWFKPAADFLREVPTIYAAGNHDISPYYEDFFLNAQKNTYHSDDTGHNSSFNYGNVHIIVLDSTPWGLFEMNAINSSLPVDEVTKKNLDISLKWLNEDLQSVAAVEATWRILVLHHPYTDDFTYKHIAELGEKYNVNLVIAGHVHYYIKNVSVNPKVGAKTVYISQGSAQDYSAGIDYGTMDKRLLTDFPEVVATGQVNYSEIIIEGETLIFKAYGFTEGAVGAQLIDEVKLVKAEPKIIIDDIVITTDAQNNKLIITGNAENQGAGLAALALPIIDNGKEILQNLFGSKGNERVIALDPGVKTSFSAEYNIEVPGMHNITVGDVQNVIEVLPLEPINFANMTAKVGQGAHSNTVFVTVEVTNNTDSARQTNIDLYIDEQNASTQNIALSAYEKKLLELSYSFTQGGNYKVAISKLAPKEITIEGTLKITPIIKDLSGNGNHGFLRGTPRIITAGEMVTVSFDNDDDYVEIPDSDSLHVADGYTGMVWANINRLVSAGEMGHNPLMVKGISTGWGVTYLVRMAIERGGDLKWGTCYDTTEYSWQGGSVTVGDWVQYTSSFDKKTGGASYCNDKQVAETIGIKDEEMLCNWEGLPLFVGYSYIGHIIKEIGRPKYFTHLPAKISQIRFYRRKLSHDENQYIYEHPSEVGLNSEELVTWLNFKDIETTGIHTTEWRRPAIFKPAYKADKRYWNFAILNADTLLTGSAALSATVEVSDDGETIKAAEEIMFSSGKQAISLTSLPAAQYIRVITKFTAAITDEGTYIPELNQYKIIAYENETKVELNWGTRVDWERGIFTGAIGFAPLDRTRVFDEYTDVIHG